MPPRRLLLARYRPQRRLRQGQRDLRLAPRRVPAARGGAPLKSVVVTGAGGFLGRHWVPFVESQGCACTRFSARRPTPSTSGAGGGAGSGGARGVFHLAGVADSRDVAEFYRVNAVFAANLFTAMQRAGLEKALLVLVGTSAEYGPARCVADAARGKRAVPAAGALRDQQARADTYGAGDGAAGAARARRASVESRRRGHAARTWRCGSSPNRSAAATRGGPRTIATGDLSVVRDFIDVQDACVRALGAVPGGGRQRGDCRTSSGGRRRVLRSVARLVGLAGGGIEVDRPARLRANDVRAHVTSPAKLERLVHPPALTPFDDTLRRVLAWRSRLRYNRARDEDPRRHMPRLQRGGGRRTILRRAVRRARLGQAIGTRATSCS